ncbi:MAG: biliverdin-producing heme oxygenase [Aliihoeflea sp.]|uniref:biliverdin-producing heme oxygenase n=1 Tax=Aliihoeflea sp. TaxID=2608088 RepID=UPI004034A255
MHRFFLREATRDLHHELDTAISQLDLGEPDDYAAFLRIHAAALLPLEVALEAGGVASRFAAWPRHRRSEALKADLRACGIGPEYSETLAPIESTEAQMGVLYVLEGSRLGGRLLARQAAGQEGRNAFLLHGAGLPLWQDFLSQLERLPDEDATRDGLANGACMAFTLYGRAAGRILGAMQRPAVEAVGSVENANRIAAPNQS